MKSYTHPIVVFLVVLLGFLQTGYAQVSRRDSLLNELNRHEKPDSSRLMLLIWLSEASYLSNPADAMKYAGEARTLSQQLNNPGREGDAIRLQGLAHYMTGKYPEARKFFQQAYSLDSLHQSELGMAASLTNLGLIDLVQSRFPTALDYYLRGLKYYEDIGNLPNTGPVNISIGIIYSEMEQYDKALEHLGRAMEVFKKLGNKSGVATCLGNMGVVSGKKKKYGEALGYFKDALQMNTELGITSAIARENGNVGGMLSRLGNYEEALTHHQKALEIYRSIDNKKGIAINLQGIGFAQMKLDLPDALKYLTEGYKLANEIGLLDVQQEAANDLSEYYTRHRQPDSALVYFKKHVAFRDSLQSEQNKKQITRLEMQYEFDKKETAYKQEQLLSEARVREKDLLLKVSQEQLTRAQQEQKIQQLAYQNAQNQLQVAELGRLELERKKELAEKEKNEQAALLKVVSQEAELARLRNRQQILYASLGIAILILLSGFMVSQARTRQIRLRNELERQRAEQLNRDLAHERQLLESELKTIRSQMNPHFIFNVLNSIESYILEKEPETASRLVQKFATLSRLILEHSTQSYVTADVEWRVLKLYVELEAVRFNHQFAYRFEAETDLPMAELRIPPMLVQPLVENAILHGLRPYTGNDGMLRVSLVQREKEVIFTVSDNGVGLNTKPRQTENPLSVKRQSIALKAIRDRVELINQVARDEVASFELKDKREEGGRGTEAILRLPVQLEIEQRISGPLI